MNIKMKYELRGWWVLLLCGAVVIAGQYAGFYYGTKAFVPSQGPGSAPPFNFIRIAYIDGICRGVSLLIVAIISSVFWRRYPQYAGMGLWMGVLWLGGGIIKSIVIAFNTTNILSPMAETTWATFDDYIRDPMIRASSWIGILSGLAIAFIIRPRNSQQGVSDYRRQSAPQSEP